MHRLLVNALSVTNQSGDHVLRGHIGYLLNSLEGVLRVTVLCREDMASLRDDWDGRVDWTFAPMQTRGWVARFIWEQRYLTNLIRTKQMDAYFAPSGMAAQELGIPQVVFCQNPWALVPAARRWHDAPKAWLQRLAYRRTMSLADVVIFNSYFMQQAYRENAGCRERTGRVVYQAPGDDTLAHAATWGEIDRVPGQIICASAMGPHKNVEAVVRAFGLLRSRGHADASLILAGGWPDYRYENRIRELVRTLDLESYVRFTGFVSRETLDRFLAESQVFCLMSRCESFGIPAIEAQLFGTPVISSNVCAVPEVCGEGGLYYDPNDSEGVANGLVRLLDDASLWQRMSVAARQNAAKYTWEQCSPAIVELLRNMLSI
jgi:glycosyltransferase involved in cell wall biosynthesis